MFLSWGACLQPPKPPGARSAGAVFFIDIGISYKPSCFFGCLRCGFAFFFSMRLLWSSGCLAVPRCRYRCGAVCRGFFAFGGCPEPPRVVPSPVCCVPRGTFSIRFLSMNSPFLSTFRGFLSTYSFLFSCIYGKNLLPLWVVIVYVLPFRFTDYV